MNNLYIQSGLGIVEQKEKKIVFMKIMKCPKCNKEVSPEWKVCPWCGYEPVKCDNPDCNGGWLPKEALFCPMCGKQIKHEKEASTPKPIIDVLSPMDYGIVLGKTTLKEAAAMPTAEQSPPHADQCIHVGGRSYWDHNRDGIIESCYITQYYGIPHQWIVAGISFSKSYSDWIEWFRENGFSQKAIKEPTIEDGSLSAKIEGYNKDTRTKLELNFNYSKKKSIHDTDTLYSITVVRVKP